MSRIMDVWNNAQADGRESITVALHNGRFHLDEILSLVWLGLAGISYNIIRTRDPKVINECDLAIDVGGSNDGHIFDHHQRGFEYTHVDTPDIRYAACGLVWDDLADVILERLCGPNKEVQDSVRDKIMTRLVVPTDAVDTGTVGALNPYTLPTLADIVGAYNSFDPDLQDGRFGMAATNIATIVGMMINNWAQAAIEEQLMLSHMRQELGSSSGILILDELGPWKEVALKHWDEMSRFNLVIFKDPTDPRQYRIQSFPGDPVDPFKQKCSAPAHWKGLKEGQFTDGPCPDQMVFVHPNGFIGGVRGDLQDALHVAHFWLTHSSSY